MTGGPRYRLVDHGGHLVPRDQATLAMTSVALRYAVSVFEGVRLYLVDGGEVRPWLLGPHLDRLRHSCAGMGLDPAVVDDVPERLASLATANGVDGDAYARIAVSAAGDGDIGDEVESLLTIVITPSGRKRWLAEGARLRLAVSRFRRADDLVFPSSVKSISSYSGPRLALAQAKRDGFDNCVLTTADGAVSEAPTASLFVVRGGELLTPPRTDSVLPGVTRSWILATAGRLGVPAREARVWPEHLRTADEAFLVGTGIEFGPVDAVDDVPMPAASPVLDVLVDEYFAQARGRRPATPVVFSADVDPRGTAGSIVDGPRATGWARHLAARPDRARETMATLTAAAGPMQNRPHPLSPTPVFVAADAYRAHRRDAEAYVAMLGRVIGLFRERPEVRRWYGLGADAERLVDAEAPPAGPDPWVCRLDGYVDNGRVVVLENNADAPAGTMFTPRVNRLGLEATTALRDDGEPSPLGGAPSPESFLDDATFRRALLAQAATEHPSVAVLQPDGAASVECAELVRALVADGHDAFLADPRSVHVGPAGVDFAGRRADLCWNKVNTASWAALMSGATVKAWAEALAHPGLRVCNSSGARAVAENKRSLALPFDPALRGLLGPADRAVAERLLPWAAAVHDDAVDERGDALLPALLGDRGSWVLKAPYDIRGDGVTVGHATDEAAWRAAVEEALAGGHIAQRRVHPAVTPVLDLGSGTLVDMAFSLDTYVLDGRAVGFGSKAGTGPKINVFQGGQKLPVLVVGDGGSP